MQRSHELTDTYSPSDSQNVYPVSVRRDNPADSSQRYLSDGDVFEILGCEVTAI